MFTQRRSIIFFIVFASLRIICGVYEGEHPKAPIPYMAAVKEDMEIGFNLCSAAIVASHWLLSHSPCLYKLRGKLVVVAGSVDVTHPGIVSDIRDVITHNQYDFNETNTVALVQTTSKMIGPKRGMINITKLPWAGADYSGCMFAGYGFRTYENENVFHRNITNGILHKKNVGSLDYKPATCGCLNKDQKQIKKAELICVSGHNQAGLCIGDFGGPLVCKTKKEGTVIVAVAANFEPCGDYNYFKQYIDSFRQFPCGHESSVETYTFVYPYAKWIHNEIEKKSKLAKIRLSFSSANRLLQIPPLSLLLFIWTINYITTLHTIL